ncbi:MAG: KTSC domain-containing protein [Rhodocyclaceae bacterium]|nr:KTSC domain-containing protein [Rhodocyclaceae bacterium]
MPNGSIPVAGNAQTRVSSWIVSDLYDANQQTLLLETKKGIVYSYQGVTKDVYDQYDAASSKGNAFNTWLKHLAFTMVSLAEYEALKASVSTQPKGRGRRRKANTRIFKLRVPGRYISPTCMW